MPTPPTAWTKSGAARLLNVAEETFARQATKAGLVPVMIISSGSQMRPVYDEASILKLKLGTPLHVLTRIESDRLVAARQLEALDSLDQPTPQL